MFKVIIPYAAFHSIVRVILAIITVFIVYNLQVSRCFLLVRIMNLVTVNIQGISRHNLVSKYCITVLVMLQVFGKLLMNMQWITKLLQIFSFVWQFGLFVLHIVMQYWDQLPLCMCIWAAIYLYCGLQISDNTATVSQ